MTIVDGSDDEPVEEAHSRLAEGLKSCRAVVNNYRSLLTSDLDGEAQRESQIAPNYPGTDAAETNDAASGEP